MCYRDGCWCGFFFSSRRRHTRYWRDWSSDVCSSDLFRLARGGGQQRYGVTPDLATYGKIIGGGYPVSAIAGRRELLELASPRRAGQQDYAFISGTLSGNPIGAVAGLATLAELSQPGAFGRLDHAGETLRSGFNTAAQEL